MAQLCHSQILIFIILWCSLEVVIKSEIVHIYELGLLQGSTTISARSNRLIYQFLGVKYAESPSKLNRYKPPIPVRPWFDIRDVSKHGRQCPQLNTLIELKQQGLLLLNDDIEDCLHMSIYSNNLTPKRNVPVMVYIHGGSFYEGSSTFHPPNYLLEKDIVLVVPQYRLGPLGFLSTMTDTIPGNVAALDTILALEFVHKYIHYFGGDASRVTLFGQSAGSAMVSALVVSPIVPTYLYDKVIQQSGGISSSWAIDKSPVDSARDIANRFGCNGNASITQLNQCFVNIDVFSLLWAFTEHLLVGSLNGLHNYGANKFVIGGPINLFPISPTELMLHGYGRSNLPMMAGVTKHDGSFKLASFYDIINKLVGINNTRINSFKMIDLVNRLSGINDETGSLYGYMTQTLFSQQQLNDGSFLDMLPGWFDISSVNILKATTFRVAKANAFFNPEQTYLYTFDYQGKFTRFGYGSDVSEYPFEGGIHHSDENIYLFPYPPFASRLNNADARMSEIMVDLWTSFAITGRPYSSIYPLWPPMTNITGPYIHLNKYGHIGEDFLDEYSVTVREGLPSCADCITEYMNGPKRYYYKLLVRERKLIYNNDSYSLSSFV